MKDTHKLIIDISNAEDHTSQLEKKVNHLESNLNKIHNTLEVSKDVNTNLHRLDDALVKASKLLGKVAIIPSISRNATKTKKTIDKYEKPVRKAMLRSDRFETKVEPLRRYVWKAYKRARQFDDGLLVAINVENSVISVLGKVQHCVETLPKSEPKKQLDFSIDNLSHKIDPTVLKFDSYQVKLLELTSAMEKKTDKIIDNLEKLVALNKWLKKAINELSPFIKALDAVVAVFKKKIKVYYGGYPKICYKKVGFVKVPYTCGWHKISFSFRIEQILSGIKGAAGPVIKLLNKEMGRTLKPLLKKLDFNIKLPEIPYLNEMNKVFNYLEKVLSKIYTEMLEVRTSYNKAMKESSKVQNYIDKIQKVSTTCLTQHN